MKAKLDCHSKGLSLVEVVFLPADISNRPTVSAEDAMEETKQNCQWRQHGKTEESITKVNK